MTTQRAIVPGEFHRRVKVVNQKGLHARAARKFVLAAQRFQADIHVGHGGLVVQATSIMGLMMLAAATGAVLEIGAAGDDAEQALDELEQLVAEGFEEP
jgi:phosphocarrier protein